MRIRGERRAMVLARIQGQHSISDEVCTLGLVRRDMVRMRDFGMERKRAGCRLR